MTTKNKLIAVLRRLRSVSDKRVIVGTNEKRNAYLLGVHEFGKGHNPPRPMFGNAIPTITENLTPILTEMVDKVVEGKLDADYAYDLIGRTVTETVSHGIISNTLGLQPLKPATIRMRKRKKEQAKKDKEAPTIRSIDVPLYMTGRLARSFIHKVIDK